MDKEYSKRITEIVKYSRLGYQRVLTIADSGNVSCRYKKGILVTASGIALGDVTKENILYVDLDGNILAGKEGLKPSKETHMHLQVYKGRPDIGCVYHVHPPYATAYAVKETQIPFLTSTSCRKIGDAPIVPYADPGSEELADNVYSFIREDTEKKRNALLLAGHGILTFSESVRKAFELAELMETTAKIALLSRLIS